MYVKCSWQCLCRINTLDEAAVINSTHKNFYSVEDKDTTLSGLLWRPRDQERGKDYKK